MHPKENIVLGTRTATLTDSVIQLSSLSLKYLAESVAFGMSESVAFGILS